MFWRTSGDLGFYTSTLKNAYYQHMFYICLEILIFWDKIYIIGPNVPIIGFRVDVLPLHPQTCPIQKGYPIEIIPEGCRRFPYFEIKSKFCVCHVAFVSFSIYLHFPDCFILHCCSFHCCFVCAYCSLIYTNIGAQGFGFFKLLDSHMYRNVFHE